MTINILLSKALLVFLLRTKGAADLKLGAEGAGELHTNKSPSTEDAAEFSLGDPPARDNAVFVLRAKGTAVSNPRAEDTVNLDTLMAALLTTAAKTKSRFQSL